MADQNYTHIEGLIDRSGSMYSIKSDMEGAYNSFIEAQQKMEGKCTASLHQFDGGDKDWYNTLYSFKPVQDVPQLVLDPRGCTPLLDAVGKTINNLGASLRDLPEDARPGKVIVIIITDGEENASKELSISQIKDMVTHQQDVYDWQFVFLGANFDAIGEGRKLGFKAGTSLSYAPSASGCLRMSESLLNNVCLYRAGTKHSVTFEEEDFKAQEDAGV